MLGIGIGGTAEKAAVLAKQSLMEPIDIHDLIKRGPSNRVEELRIELYRKVNQLGVGAQGLGGLTTVLDVKVLDYPNPCSVAADLYHPQLRGHASCSLHPGRFWPGNSGTTRHRRL